MYNMYVLCILRPDRSVLCTWTACWEILYNLKRSYNGKRQWKWTMYRFQDVVLLWISVFGGIASKVIARNPVEMIRGATASSKLGSNSLVWSITILIQKKIRPVYPVWCSRLHNYTLFIKKLRKKLGGPSKFRGVRTPAPDPSVVAAMLMLMYFSWESRCRKSQYSIFTDISMHCLPLYTVECFLFVYNII